MANLLSVDTLGIASGVKGLHLSVPHWEVVNCTTVFCFIIGEVDAEAG